MNAANTANVSLWDQIEAAKLAHNVLPHVLLSGPPETDKLELATAIAEGLETDLDRLDIRACKKIPDLTIPLVSLRKRSVLVLESIDTLSHEFVPMLVSVLRDFRLEILIGTGPGARVHGLPLPQFSTIATCWRIGKVHPDIRACFTFLLDLKGTAKLSEDQYSDYEKRIADRATANSTPDQLGSRSYATSLDEYNVRDANELLNERVSKIGNILKDGLDAQPFNFDCLHRNESAQPPFVAPPHLRQPKTPPEKPTLPPLKVWVRPLSFWEQLRGSKRFEIELQERTAQAQAERDALLAKYEAELAQYQEGERDRTHKLEEARGAHEERNATILVQVQAQNEAANRLEIGYSSSDPQSVIGYFSAVLSWSAYPKGFPQNLKVAYAAASKHLIIEYELPQAYILPGVTEYRYVKSRDVVEVKQAGEVWARQAYQKLVAEICLRSLHEVFKADFSGQLDVVTFNGFVQAIDPATGREISPHLISVRVTKDAFSELDLHRVEPKACLRNLGAQLSPQPSELIAVKPIIEFEMFDRRFVEQTDVISDLDSRPNLMDLTPFEFENLVGNLFTRMGLETKLTRSHRDGGVDAIAYDTRPILGGKVVIQAKRYQHTVGVSAVRDLFGTMNHEGANKGILVTTSSYGPDAYDFMRNKPIELVDGSALLYHLEQTGSKAKIVFPISEP